MASIVPVSALSDLRISGKDGKKQALDQVVVSGWHVSKLRLIAEISCTWKDTSSCDRGKRNNEQEIFQRQHIEDIKVTGKKGQPNYMALKANNVCIRAQAHSAAFFFARNQVSMDKECGYVC